MGRKTTEEMMLDNHTRFATRAAMSCVTPLRIRRTTKFNSCCELYICCKHEGTLFNYHKSSIDAHIIIFSIFDK